MTDPEPVAPATEGEEAAVSGRSMVAAVIRLGVLFVVVLVLPLLLMAAMTHPEGCGGG